MSDKIEVSKIEITIGDKVLSLSVKELKDLKTALNALFPELVFHHWNPPERTVERIYIDRPVYKRRSPLWGDYEVTCKSDTLQMMATTYTQ